MTVHYAHIAAASHAASAHASASRHTAGTSMLMHCGSAQGLHWYSYAPPRRRWYLGQSTMLNECLYRQRHAYEHLLFMDADEFLVVRHPQTCLHLFQAWHSYERGCTEWSSLADLSCILVL